MGAVDDGLVLTGAPIVLVPDLSQADPVVDDLVEGGLVEGIAVF